MSHATSGFIATGTAYNVPPNYTLMLLQMMTWDRQNMNTASFTVTGTDYTETVQCDAAGRAMLLVPSGATYTVILNHQGSYINDGPQTVVANSEEIVWVDYDLIQEAVAVFTDVVVSASDWVSDSTYPDYPYKATLSLAVDANDVPEVVFDVSEATSGRYCPVAVTFNGGVYIWSTTNEAMTIPTIVVKRRA